MADETVDLQDVGDAEDTEDLGNTEDAEAQSVEYSAIETETGKRWIDGKPIYRKVISGTNGNTPSAYVVSKTIQTGVDSVIRTGGWVVHYYENGYPPARMLVGTMLLDSIPNNNPTKSTLSYFNTVELDSNLLICKWCTGRAVNYQEYQIWSEYTKV